MMDMVVNLLANNESQASQQNQPIETPKSKGTGLNSKSTFQVENLGVKRFKWFEPQMQRPPQTPPPQFSVTWVVQRWPSSCGGKSVIAAGKLWYL